jgi:hypothetical protein
MKSRKGTLLDVVIFFFLWLVFFLWNVRAIAPTSDRAAPVHRRRPLADFLIWNVRGVR